MSTNVPLVSNLPASGKSSYATYISADEMMFSIALGGFEDVPDESNFKANIYFEKGSLIEKSVMEKSSLIDSNAEMPTRRKVKTHRERLSEKTPLWVMQQSDLAEKQLLEASRNDLLLN